MTILLSVIHDTPSNTLEATWVDEGTTIKCHNYSIEQKGMFLADCAEFGTPPESSSFSSVCDDWLDPLNNINPYAGVYYTPKPSTQFSSLAFLDRFTQAEQLSVVQATMVSAEVKLWYDRLLAADFVDLEDPRTEAGVDALIMAGLLDPSRKLEILTP